MKILKVEKDKVQVQLTQKELTGIVFCLDGVMQDIAEEKFGLWMQQLARATIKLKEERFTGRLEINFVEGEITKKDETINECDSYVEIGTLEEINRPMPCINPL